MSDAQGAGDALRGAREALGLSLEEAAQQLKFSARQLEALERGELFKLGTVQGGAYLKGMVRGYARLLKLDPEPLIAGLSDRVALPDTDRLAARFKQPVPFSDGSRRMNLVYASLSVLLLAVVGAVAFEWREEPAKPARAAVKPAVVPAKVEAPEPASTPEPVAAAQAAETPVVPEKPIEAAPASEGSHRIILRFDRESWVEIKDGEGRTLLSQLNPGGTQRTVDGNPPFSVVIGNAQHVRLLYDNNAIDLTPHVKVEVARLSLD
jgi:cytoskeleton protein RodZ